jgi:endonuclease/exonuclease/phosphatase family metal-dependent hydrolase
MRKFLGVVSALVTGLVLVGLVVLTAARFVDSGDRWLILLATFSSYAVLGFLVVLVGCALTWRWARRRRWVAVFALLAALGLVVQGFALVPLFVGGSSGKPALTVMTSNLEFGRADTVAVVRAVASQHVDVLALEEVTPRALDALLAAGLPELLPNRAGAPSYAANGTMIFSRYRLTSSRPFAIGNGGLDVRVEAPKPFRMLAVHASQPVGWTGPWLADIEAVRQRASATVAEGPTVVAGDFNATRDHAQLRAVLDTGLHDAAEQAGSGWQPTWPTRYRVSWLRPVIAIDHVMTTAPYEAIRTWTVEIPHTDHRALLAQLRLRNHD